MMTSGSGAAMGDWVGAAVGDTDGLMVGDRVVGCWLGDCVGEVVVGA